LRELVVAQAPGRIDPKVELPALLAAGSLGIERLAPYVALSSFKRDTATYRDALKTICFDAYGYLMGIPEGPRARVAEDLARSHPRLAGAWSFVPAELPAIAAAEAGPADHAAAKVRIEPAQR
jgi:hypothetical protein